MSIDQFPLEKKLDEPIETKNGANVYNKYKPELVQATRMYWEKARVANNWKISKPHFYAGIIKKAFSEEYFKKIYTFFDGCESNEYMDIKADINGIVQILNAEKRARSNKNKLSIKNSGVSSFDDAKYIDDAKILWRKRKDELPPELQEKYFNDNYDNDDKK